MFPLAPLLCWWRVVAARTPPPPRSVASSAVFLHPTRTAIERKGPSGALETCGDNVVADNAQNLSQSRFQRGNRPTSFIFSTSHFFAKRDKRKATHSQRMCRFPMTTLSPTRLASTLPLVPPRSPRRVARAVLPLALLPLVPSLRAISKRTFPLRLDSLRQGNACG